MGAVKIKLTNATTGRELASDVETAVGLAARTAGLLGRGELPVGRALWILRCNSVHTWFMRFAIDVVFVDGSLVATKVVSNLVPWRVTAPSLRSRSVFELPAGTLLLHPVAPGDQLHVGD